MSSRSIPDNVNEVMHNMPKAFHPDRAEGVNADIQFRFTGQQPGNYVVSINNGQAAVREGETPNPAATIESASETWLSIVRGDTNPMTAFMTGKLRATGDMSLLMRMQTMFG